MKETDEDRERRDQMNRLLDPRPGMPAGDREATRAYLRDAATKAEGWHYLCAMEGMGANMDTALYAGRLLKLALDDETFRVVVACFCIADVDTNEPGFDPENN